MKRTFALALSVLLVFSIITYFRMSRSSSSEENTFPLVACGWLPWWDMENALQEYNSHTDVINHISPFVYDFTPAFTLEEKVSSELLTQIQGIESSVILPTITNNFNTDSVSTMLNNESARNKLIEDLSLLSDSYDGIEIDFEEMKADDKDLFTLFIKDLASVLHAKNKLLSIAVHPKLDDEGSWEGNKAQDWHALSDHADYIKIMAYDYHWSTSKSGPLAPISWVKEITAYAKRTIPKEKRILGIGLYGYTWEVGSEKATSLNLADIDTLLSDYQLSPNYSKAFASPYLKYTADGKDMILWFENEKSIAQKLEVVKKDYAGFCIWPMGGNRDSIYETIKESL